MSSGLDLIIVKMKRTLFLIMLFVACFLPVSAQSSLNNVADNIVGEYKGAQGSDPFKVRITKQQGNTYKAQIIWVQKLKDADGKIRLDAKNPNKELRTVPADKIVLMDGLKYNESKDQWDGTKIYDPQRGIRANVVCTFSSDGSLKLKGSVMGIGETVTWTKIK
jgi:uncharacterized protein (DUF2147 family)